MPTEKSSAGENGDLSDGAVWTTGSGERFTHLFENIQDAVVEFELVEETPVVRAVNPAFVEVFGYEAETIRGESLNEFIVPDVYAGEAQTFDDRTDDGKHNKAVVRRETANGIRRFLYRSVPYERGDGSAYGFAMYSDITDQTRREHRLQVLHRILRHNLRNDVTVIKGVATELERDTDDPEVAALTRQIQRRADQLDHLSNEAGRVERILDRAGDADIPVDIAALCERVVSDYQNAFADAHLRTETPDSLTVSTTEYIEVALQQLVENAVEHNDSETPHVVVQAERASAWVEIRVKDDGPQIPEGEKQIFTTEEPPTQLSHGSGLGLRLVQWITDAVGGTVEIGQSDLGGNVVRLRFKQPSVTTNGDRR